jgi:hypothetical protein
LFQRKDGVSYKEIKDADIDGKAERLAMHQSGFKPDEVLGHRYANCLGWSSDSRSILIHLTGSGQVGKDFSTADWFGIYEVIDGSFTVDLSKFNRGAVEKEKVP